MKLLLHACCAPCLIYPLEQLRKNNSEITGFYYNPNIHPSGEFEKRRQAVVDYSRAQGLDFLYPAYSPSEFNLALNSCTEFPARCRLCWHLRLKRTALAAKEKKIGFFSTTLLVSPYQDHEMLKKIGFEISKETGVVFYYEDFRAGFHKARKEAREKGIYMQKYCGCTYSEIDRCRKSASS